MKIFSIIFILSSFSYCAAQSLNNINGTSVHALDFSDVKGSPYLFENWAIGSVRLNDNTIYDDMNLKYDILDNKLYFKGKSQDMQQFVASVKEFKISVPGEGIKSVVFRNGYQNIPGVDSASFLEVLTEGKMQLLKKLSKKIQQENIYPNTSTNKFFSDSKTYYLLKSGKGTLIKPDRKSILSVFPDKVAEIESFIKQNNINLKDDADLAKIINYYNSISN